MSTIPADVAVAGAAPATRPVAPRRRDRRSILVFGIPLGVLILVSLVASWLPLPDPNRQMLRDSKLPPLLFGGSWDHPLGTDLLGRDMLSRLVHGGQLALILGIGGTLAGLLPGVTLGLIGGYRRGWVDAAISRVVEAQLALPGIMLAIAILVSSGRSVTVIIVVLSLLSWAQYARIVRAETIALRDRTFVLALRAAGVPTRRIIFRHLLANTAGSISVLAALQVGGMILIESSLSFLGLGVVAPDISWGAMLAGGRDQITQAWWIATLPGVAISLVVLLTNLFADALRRAYDPRQRTY